MALALWAWLVVCAWAGMPVESVSYAVDVVGPLAEVTVRQVFVNDGPDVIEAVYVFPMHEEAAVDGLTMRIGDRVIEGRIQERGAAVAEYTEALEEGFTAALTTQQRPNVFTQSVGNLAPGARVEVELRAVQPVPHLDGAYELVIPLVVMPRFVRPDELEATLQGLPTARHERPTWSPPMAVNGTPLRATLDVALDAGLPFTEIACTTHDVGISEIGPHVRAITSEVPMDKDFVLRWSVDAARPEVAAFVQSGHALITLEPPETAPREQIVPRELIWVIDQSGSMSGRPIELAREAMFEALEHVDERDSLRILRFSNRVVGDAASVPMSPRAKMLAQAQIRSMQAGGGTYLLEGVSVALDTRPDPTRERYVMFLTDAAISDDRRLLATIADKVGSARLFAFGVGPASNRWLLDEMSRFGGGKTTWIRDGESPAAAIQRFVDTIDKPVLTDITVDWGDWEVEETWPRRLPALYAGQPLLLTTRVIHQGTTPVVIRGRLGDGGFERVIHPEPLEEGRAIPSTWARQKIANLERDQVWGEERGLAREILDTSLAYQVLSQYTAFLAVDRSVRVRRDGPLRTEVQPNPRPDGAFEDLVAYGSGESGQTEITVQARRDPIHTSDTSTSEVLTKDFLSRLPTGRSYQSAVGLSAGVTGQGGNKSLSGGATNENTYLLDGANITDPVTGTFSVNFNFDTIEQIEVLLGGMLPEHTGTGPVVNVVTESGTNNLELAASLAHEGGRDLRHETVSAKVAGPVVRDNVWVVTGVQLDDARLADRTWQGATGFAKLTAQPATEHRFSLSGQLNPWTVTSPALSTDHLGGYGQGRWQWFFSPAVNLDTVATVTRADLGGDRTSRDSVSTRLSAIDLRDPLGGRHDLKFGAEATRLRWRNEGPISEALLGAGLTVDPDADTASAFAQDSWKPVSNFTINAGSRLDVAFGRALPGPRIGLAWDPWSDQRTKLATGVGRYQGVVDLVAAAAPPAGTLTRRDELFAVAERVLVEDFALKLWGTASFWDGVPTLTGERIAQRELRLDAIAHKVTANRWEAQAAWSFTRAVLPVRDTLVNDGVTAPFAHAGSAWVYWDLPTDPWTQTISAWGSVALDPLGTAVPSGDPDAPRWSGGVRFSQTLDVRKGRLLLDGSVEHQGDVYAARPLDELRMAAEPVPGLPAAQGFRWGAGLTYEF